ncbi:MAG: hypothetical protein MJ072_03705, partial [Clostridia bacterium]|nr:hypothetical protein [Clostridia bacterium]
MYKVSVPVMFEIPTYDREKVVCELRRMKADRVFLILTRKLKFHFTSREVLDKLSVEIKALEKEGFEVGVWIGETIGHACWVLATPEEQLKYAPYRRMVNVDGVEIGAFCPSDERFVNDIAGWVVNVAKAGAKTILLDDDFRLERDGIFCCCDYHMKEFERKVGEKVTRDDVKKAYTGKTNR